MNSTESWDTSHAGTIWIAYDDERFVESKRRGDEVELSPADGEPSVWTAAERQDCGIYEKCIDCDEGRGTCPEGRCRDCDIDHVMGRSSCRECHRWILAEEFAGITTTAQHKPGCSIASSADPYPE